MVIYVDITDACKQRLYKITGFEKNKNHANHQYANDNLIFILYVILFTHL